MESLQNRCPGTSRLRTRTCNAPEGASARSENAGLDKTLTSAPCVIGQLAQPRCACRANHRPAFSCAACSGHANATRTLPSSKYANTKSHPLAIASLVRWRSACPFRQDHAAEAVNQFHLHRGIRSPPDEFRPRLPQGHRARFEALQHELQCVIIKIQRGAHNTNMMSLHAM